MIALHHDAPVIGKARQDRQCRVRVEHIGGIKVGHALVRFGKSGYLHVYVDAEHFPRVDFAIGRGQQRL